MDLREDERLIEWKLRARAVCVCKRGISARRE